MPIDVASARLWAEKNKAAWEIEPLVEMHEGSRVVVGFRLDLYARLPASLPSAEEAFATLWDRLREIAESLLPLVGSEARMELDPFDAAGRLRPETGFALEVLLQARIFHSSDYFAPVGEDDWSHLRPIEGRLRELGLRQRSW